MVQVLRQEVEDLLIQIVLDGIALGTTCFITLLHHKVLIVWGVVGESRIILGSLLYLHDCVISESVMVELEFF